MESRQESRHGGPAVHGMEYGLSSRYHMKSLESQAGDWHDRITF